MNKDYYYSLIEEGIREDNRAFFERRKLEYQINPIKNAEGSALVKLGETLVIAGVKFSLAEPFPDTPDKGIIIVDFDLSPVSHKDTPAELIPLEAEFARVIDRGIREGNVIDLSKLVIKKGELVWAINIDIAVLNNDGNVIDAGGIASILALANAYLPKLDKKTKRIIHGTKDKKLKLKNIVFPFTYVKIKDKLLYDPNFIEEELSTVRFTILRSKNHIHGVQKSKDGFLEEKEIETLLKDSKKQYSQLEKELKKLIK
jgi:exosome complex component RRP42